MACICVRGQFCFYHRRLVQCPLVGSQQYPPPTSNLVSGRAWSLVGPLWVAWETSSGWLGASLADVAPSRVLGIMLVKYKQRRRCSSSGGWRSGWTGTGSVGQGSSGLLTACAHLPHVKSSQSLFQPGGGWWPAARDVHLPMQRSCSPQTGKQESWMSL